MPKKGRKQRVALLPALYGFLGENMKVQFFAYLREPAYADCKEAGFLGAGTVRALGEQLCDRFGAKFRSEFFDASGEALSERIIVMVNGRRVDFLQGLDTGLAETDTVQVFPVVAGG